MKTRFEVLALPRFRTCLDKTGQNAVIGTGRDPATRPERVYPVRYAGQCEEGDHKKTDQRDGVSAMRQTFGGLLCVPHIMIRTCNHTRLAAYASGRTGNPGKKRALPSTWRSTERAGVCSVHLVLRPSRRTVRFPRAP